MLRKWKIAFVALALRRAVLVVTDSVLAFSNRDPNTFPAHGQIKGVIHRSER